MYETQTYAVGCHPVVDHVTVSRAAALASEHQRAARERRAQHKAERKAQRLQRRVDRRGREHYTTAV